MGNSTVVEFERLDKAERQGRVDLAAAFRLAARHNWHEAVANHFSLAVVEDGSRFLMNPCNRHFSRIRASELLLLDVAAPEPIRGDGPPDPTAWHIHGQIHAAMPEARCVLHAHPIYATTLACLKGYRLEMIDQNAMRFHNRIAYDDDFAGLAMDEDEGARICAAMEGKGVMMMANHGVTVIGASVADAFDELYYLERACHTQVLALSTGRPLDVVPDAVAEKTCHQWHNYPVDQARNHFEEMKRILDEEEPDYAS